MPAPPGAVVVHAADHRPTSSKATRCETQLPLLNTEQRSLFSQYSLRHFLAIAVLINICLTSNIRAQNTLRELTEEEKSHVAQLKAEVDKLEEQGNYDGALRLLEQIIGIKEKALGTNHPEVGIAMINLGSAYYSKAEYARAEVAILYGLGIYEKTLPPDHPEVAVGLNNLGSVYYQQHKYKEAAELLERAVKINEHAFGPQHPSVANTLGTLGAIYTAQGEFTKAEAELSRALSLLEKALGPNSPELGPIVNNLALVYDRQRDHAHARPLLERALKLQEKALGSENPRLASYLRNLAEDYMSDGKYLEAEPYYQRALVLRQKAFGPDHTLVAESTLELGTLYMKNRDFARAEPLYLKALTIYERDSETASEEVSTLTGLGALYSEHGDYARAKSMLERAITVAEKTFGPTHKKLVPALLNLGLLHQETAEYTKSQQVIERALSIAQAVNPVDQLLVAECLARLATLFQTTGNYTKSRELQERVVTAFEQVLGPDHPQVAVAVSNLASIYRESGDAAHAESLYQRALASNEKAFGKRSVMVAQSLNNLGVLYSEQGQYSKAATLLKESVSIIEDSQGPDSFELMSALGNLASFNEETGNYLEAERAYKRVIAISERAFGPDHPDVALALRNLGTLYVQIGNHEQALSLFTRALNIREKALGPDHRYVGTSLDDLGHFYMTFGLPALAKPFVERGASVLEKALGPDHPDVGEAVGYVARVYAELGDAARAEALFRRKLSIYEKAFGPDNAVTASAASDLGGFLLFRGDYKQAEPLLQRALTLTEKELGPDHPDVALSLTKLATLHLATNQPNKALELLRRGAEIRERNTAIMLTAGSEGRKLSYLSHDESETDEIISLHTEFAPNDANAAQLALLTILRRKGRVLDTSGHQLAALRARMNPQDQALMAQLQEARMQLASLVLKGPGKTPAAEHDAIMTKIGDEARRLEGQISERSPALRLESQTVSVSVIQQLIPTDAALVEIVSHESFNPKATKLADAWGAGTPRYIAYVLHREGPPVWVDLGERPQIDKDVKKFQFALHDPRRTEVKELARNLDEQIMRPIRKLLRNVHHLLISPDGALNLIPFAALVDEQGHYLIGNYTLTYLTSGRDLLRLQNHQPSRHGPFIEANPEFSPFGSKGSEEQTRPSGAGTNPTRSFTMRFTPLLGSAAEAREIGTMFSGATVLTGDQATETKLKQVDGPNILHIATHGFFLSNQARQNNVSTGTSIVDQNQTAIGGQLPGEEENPLLRSGLALAGANRLDGGQGEDGVLTALEASGLNLLGTKLVVLSACETGVGDVANNEGVYGLRRAFLLAGAETEVITLWRVDDEATRELIVDFYRRLLSGAGRAEALRGAQLQMMKNEDQAHPYFWAAFIESGEWRSLGPQ